LKQKIAYRQCLLSTINPIAFTKAKETPSIFLDKIAKQISKEKNNISGRDDAKIKGIG
jgi:hypothetical protein